MEQDIVGAGATVDARCRLRLHPGLELPILCVDVLLSPTTTIPGRWRLIRGTAPAW